MNLDHLQAELRPRLPWEATDLGLALGRRHALPLVKAWLVAAWPVWLLAGALLWLAPGWAWVPLWWLKPMMAVMPAYVLSRRLFGITPGWRQAVQALGQWLGRRAWWDLTLGRFFLRRSVLQIVRILEGARTPKERAQLFRHTTPAWLIKGCLLVELSLLFGLVLAVFWIGPSSWLPWSEENGGFEAWFDSLKDDTAASPGTHRLIVINTLAYALASMASELIYLSCSFGCYLNTRSEIEGWDIEIAFKRFARRAAALAGQAPLVLATAIAAAAITIGSLPHPAHGQQTTTGPDPAGLAAPPEIDTATAESADPDAASATGREEGAEEESQANSDDARARAERILASPDFKIHRETGKRWRRPERTGERVDLSWLEPLAWIAAILVIVAVLAVFGWLVYRAAMMARGAGDLLPARAGPRAVAGLDVRPESLPDDPVAMARQWWAEGRARAALGLLYRASLSWLIHHGGVPIEESDTEGDCLRHVARTPSTARQAPYFQQLTRAWLGLAYAGHVPEEAAWDALCATWPFQASAATGASVARGSRLTGAAALLAVLLLLPSCGRFEDMEETIGFRGPARYNPFLAVSRLSEESGVGARSSFSLLQELQSNDGLTGQWVVTPSVLVNELSARRLLEAVSNGGHAVVAVSDLFPFEETGIGPSRWLSDDAQGTENDPETERKSWRDRQLKDPEADDDAEDVSEESKPKTTPKSITIRTNRSGSELRERLAETSPGVVTLMDEAGVAFAESCDEEAPTRYADRSWGTPDWDWPAAFVTTTRPVTPPARVLTIEHGDGKITFLPSLRPFTNLRIGKNEHAALWLELVVDDVNPAGDVCFLRGSGASLMAVIWDHGWRALIAAAIALVLWLTAVTKRFGLPPAEPVPAPSTATASLTATGAFLVRQREAPALLAPWGESILSRWRRQQPLERDTSLDSFLADLPAAAGLSSDEARECFLPPARLTPRRFVTLTQRLWRLERAL